MLGALALALFLTPLALHAQAPAPSGTVFTIAGPGSGPLGDGGPATNATLNYPAGAAVGSDGSIYFADNSNFRVRRIDPAGIITTVVGNGSYGDTGDGGQATSATIGAVFSIALDGARNVLYLGDDNNRVRQVNLTTGIIANFAGQGFPSGVGFAGDGGPAGLAKFSFIDGLAVDRVGNVYIVDAGNHRVRKVNIATGIINTLAGTGRAGFHPCSIAGDGGPAILASLAAPFRVAVDGPGNVFIADQGGSCGCCTNFPHLVRRVDAVTGIITTVAGGGATIPGSGPATSMDIPLADVAVNDSGILFIAGGIDSDQVFKVNLATGQLSVFAGTGTNGFSGDGGPAINADFSYIYAMSLTPAGEMLISDAQYNNRVRYIVPDSINLVCNNAQTDLRLPFINSLSGDLTAENNPSVTNVNVPIVTSVGGSVDVSGNTSATGINLSSLTTAGSDVAVNGNTSASGIDLSALATTGGGVDVSGNTSATGIDLGSLLNVGNSVDVSGNTSVSGINLSSLTTAGGNVAVSGNTSATGIDLGSLTSAGSSVNVSGNTSATGIDLGSLNSAGGVNLSGNTSATNISLTSLTNVSNTAQSLVESAHLFASPTAAADHFGSAVAIGSNTLVVTATEADLPGMADAGAAYIFTNNAGNWSAPLQITAGSFAGAGFRFGQSVALDGDTLMVGAYDRLGAPGETWGAVYVFTRSGGTWPTTPTQQLLSPQTTPPTNDFFGNAVAVSGDLAVIGEYLDSGSEDDTHAVGAVHIFKRAAGVWSAVQTITPPRPKFLGRFGASVALQGTNLLVGELGADVTVCKTDAGAVWVYALDGSGTNFVLQTMLTASDSAANDQFGQVALDGDTALIGAYSADVGSATDAGAAFVFTRTNGVWREREKLTAATPQTNGLFGSSVALRGGVAIVGAPERPAGTGSGHIFTCDLNGNWVSRRRRPTDQAVGDDFGGAVAFDGENVAWGARLDNTAGGIDAGSVYVDSLTTSEGGDVDISDNTDAESINLSELKTVGGSVSVTNNDAATTIDFAALANAGSVSVTNNDAATTIDFAALASAGSVSVTNNDAATTIDFAALASAGSVSVTNNDAATTIDFAALASAGSVSVTNNDAATTIDFAALASAGSVSVTNNDAATTIDFAALASAGGDVNVSGNTSATDINAGSLTSVGGNLTIADNGTNTMVNLNSLTCFGDGTNATVMTLEGGTVLVTNGLCIANNAMLTGSTTLEGSITNSGVIAPGSSPGRLNVHGHLALNGSSELRLQVAGYAPAQYDFVGVTGDVTLAGTLSVELLDGFAGAMTNGASFTVLTAGSPITGAFANVASGGSLTTSDGYARFTVLYAGDTSLRLANLVIADDDNDGLPNWWEDKFGFNKNDPADGALDPDGDGMSSLREFLSGTNPTNAASVFRIVSAGPVAADFAVSWTTVGGYRYVVQTVTNASGEWPTNFLDVSGVFAPAGTNEGTTNYLHEGGATNPAGYYRVRVEP